MKKMSKNETILVTLISLIKSQALGGTVFTEGKDETLFETLLGELDMNLEASNQLWDEWQSGTDEDLLVGLEHLYGLEKDGLLSEVK